MRQAAWLLLSVVPAVCLVACSKSPQGVDSRKAPDMIGELGRTVDESGVQDAASWTPNLEFPHCQSDDGLVESLYLAMTLEQRIGQHLVFRVGAGGGALDKTAQDKITRFSPGGVFVGPPSGIEFGDPAVTAAFVHQAKKLGFAQAGIPLFVCLDQEGGPNAVVNSLTGGTDTIGSMPIGATMDPQVAFEQFDVMAREIKALGFNMDLGPALDTLRSTRNGNLNTRLFGPDPELNAKLGVAAVAALQAQLVLAVGKHFPGDGLTDGNTHVDEVVVNQSLEFLEQTILIPFRAAVEAGVDGIMTIPSAYAALDPDNSAITSRKVTTGFLKGELGFEGLVVTDALGMAGIQFGLDEGQIAGLEALKAGADVLLFVDVPTEELDELVAAITAALASGEVDQDEFEASTRRILAMKQRYCLFDSPNYPEPADIETLGQRIHLSADRALSREHADRAVVLLHDHGILPLTGQKLLYVGPDTVFADPGSGWLNVVDQTFGDALAKHQSGVAQVNYFLPLNPSAVYKEVQEAVADVEVIVIGTLQGRFSLDQQQLLQWVLDGTGIPVVHVILGVPFDYAWSRDKAAAALALMGSRSVMVEAGAAVLFGKQEALGTMLFDLEAVDPGGALPDPIDPEDHENRCVDQDVTCSGGGMCVDTGAVFGCVCHPNWHPAPDGMDCIPDGS